MQTQIVEQSAAQTPRTSYTRTSFRPKDVAYPPGFGPSKVEASREALFADKEIIRVKVDGTRIYYNEERLIHRNPADGPAIEATDGSGPCYVNGVATGERYETFTETVEAKAAPITLADILGITDEENKRAGARAKEAGVALVDIVNDLNGRTHREAKVLKLTDIATEDSEERLSDATLPDTGYKSRLTKKYLDMGKLVMAVAKGGTTKHCFTDVALPDRRRSAMSNLKSGKVAPVKERRVPGTLSLSDAVSDLRNRFAR